MATLTCDECVACELWTESKLKMIRMVSGIFNINFFFLFSIEISTTHGLTYLLGCHTRVTLFNLPVRLNEPKKKNPYYHIVIVRWLFAAFNFKIIALFSV